MNWDDLRVFVAAARRKSYQDAAAALSLDPTTISRRVARLEDELRCTLLARGRNGLRLTAAGKRLFDAVSGMEATAGKLGETVAQHAEWGVVRISTSEGFGTTILAPAVPDLVAKDRKLAIEIVANPGFLSPATHQVDVAVTLSAPKDPRLSVEKLTDYALGLYAARSYLEARGEPASVHDLRAHTLVGYIDDLLYDSELRYLDEVDAGLAPILASSSIRAQKEIIAGGGGIGILPCFMVHPADRELVRVLPGTRIVRSFWLSARRDIQQSRRIRSVRNWIRDITKRKRAALLAEAAA